MALYDYTGIDSKGRKIKGRADVSSLEEVISKLRSENTTILDIFEAKKLKGKGKIKSDDLVIFSRQMASLISAGIPIVKTLGILAEQIEKKSFKEIIFSLQESIQIGNSLADSFAKYPNVFSPLFINMVHVGEFSGSLDAMMDRLASHLESYNNLTRKVKSALIYPTGIMIVAVIILAVIFIFVIPGFKKMFDSLGGALPVPTQILVSLSDFVKAYFIYLLSFLSIIYFLMSRFIRTPRGMEIKDKFSRKMPAVGKLYQKIVLARFTKTLAILVRNGVPILNSLVISARTSGSVLMEKEIENIKEGVAKGNKLANSMKESGLFPTMVVSMVGVGEEGGDLAAMLEKVSSIYEGEVDIAVAGLLSLLEPAIIVFLGVVIGGIVICLFLPILKIPQMVQ